MSARLGSEAGGWYVTADGEHANLLDSFPNYPLSAGSAKPIALLIGPNLYRVNLQAIQALGLNHRGLEASV